MGTNCAPLIADFFIIVIFFFVFFFFFFCFCYETDFMVSLSYDKQADII